MLTLLIAIFFFMLTLLIANSVIMLTTLLIANNVLMLTLLIANNVIMLTMLFRANNVIMLTMLFIANNVLMLTMLLLADSVILVSWVSLNHVFPGWLLGCFWGQSPQGRAAWSGDAARPSCWRKRTERGRAPGPRAGPVAQDRTGSTALTPGETHLGPDTGDGGRCKGLGVRVQI